MTRRARLAITAAVIGLALGLAAGMPPWPDRTTMVTISLLLLASAAIAAMWALLTIDESDEAAASPEAPLRARIHHLTIATDSADGPALAYTAVADISTDCASEAFARSQNGESSWTEGEGVEPFVDSSCRSTSVADVIDIAGRLVIVEPVGFADVASLDEALERARTTSFLALLLPNAAYTQGRFVS